MDDFKLTIEKRTRERLGKGVRIYRMVYGLAILVLGVIITIREGFALTLDTAFLGIAMILIGAMWAIYGLVGRKLVRQNIIVQVDAGLISVKRRLAKEVLINLDSVTYLKVAPFKLEFSFGDYAKAYDFSFLSTEEFERVTAKTLAYCRERGVEIE